MKLIPPKKLKFILWAQAKINGKWEDAEYTPVGYKGSWQKANASATFKSAYYNGAEFDWDNEIGSGKSHKFINLRIVPPMPNQKIYKNVGYTRM